MPPPRQQFGGPGHPPPKAAASQQRSASPVRANPNADFNMADLERLDKMMVVVALLGMIVNVVQVFAISNHAWLKATAMASRCARVNRR